MYSDDICRTLARHTISYNSMNLRNHNQLLLTILSLSQSFLRIHIMLRHFAASFSPLSHMHSKTLISLDPSPQIRFQIACLTFWVMRELEYRSRCSPQYSRAQHLSIAGLANIMMTNDHKNVPLQKKKLRHPAETCHASRCATQISHICLYLSPSVPSSNSNDSLLIS